MSSASTTDFGNAFERKLSGLLQGRVQPRSGGGYWAKLDVRGRGILASCKATKNASFPVNEPLFAEIDAEINAPGGLGGDTIGILAIEVRGEVFVVQRAEDWVNLHTNDDVQKLDASKVEARRRAARVPSLMREFADE